jgi:hypothetical protein
MVADTKPAPVQPFNEKEYLAKRDTLLAEDLPRLKATLDALGPTLMMKDLEYQKILRLLAAMVVRCATPLGPVEFELRNAHFNKVPPQYQLEFRQTPQGLLISMKIPNAPKIVVAPADTKIVKGNFGHG